MHTTWPSPSSFSSWSRRRHRRRESSSCRVDAEDACRAREHPLQLQTAQSSRREPMSPPGSSIAALSGWLHSPGDATPAAGQVRPRASCHMTTNPQEVHRPDSIPRPAGYAADPVHYTSRSTSWIADTARASFMSGADVMSEEQTTPPPPPARPPRRIASAHESQCLRNTVMEQR